MNVVEPSYEILRLPQAEDLRFLERCARTCYKSEDKMTDESYRRIMDLIMTSKHESVIEHIGATVKFIVSRGFSHELVRHRVASFSQESTRYVNYGKKTAGITVVRPSVDNMLPHQYAKWLRAMENAEKSYLALLALEVKPQIARGVLPIDLKTEIVMTANIREWRHVFKLRCAKSAHPQMQEVMRPLLQEFAQAIPIIFDDLVQEFL